MELTNEQRKYLGLELIEPTWERIEMPNNCVKPELSTGKDILLFDGDILRKVIWLDNEGSFLENSYHLKTQDNRTRIAPITSKGKPKRLNGVNIQRCTPYGMYIQFSGEYQVRGSVHLANYTTQQTYFSSGFAGLPDMDVCEFQNFLAQWIVDTSIGDLVEIQAFANAKRRHCKYSEGDFFRFKYDRRNYGYGRILLDVRKFIKSGGEFWDILMGRPLCVSVYHIVTENPNVSIADLQELNSCPSEYIMDNVFIYGEYEIIGNMPLIENSGNLNYPIMYGRSIDARERDKICYCRGRDYREIPLEENVLLQKNFRMNGIGYGLNMNKMLMKDCIKTCSNEPFWAEQPEISHTYDLRNPMYKKELEYVLKQMKCTVT